MPVSTLESESCAAAALLGSYEFLLPSLNSIINHGPRISLKAEAMKNAKASEGKAFLTSFVDMLIHLNVMRSSWNVRRLSKRLRAGIKITKPLDQFSSLVFYAFTR